LFGIPTLWLEKAWSNRVKLVASAVFGVFFVSFGIYSLTPAGRTAYALEQRERAQREHRQALDKQAADKRGAKDQAHQKALDFKRQAQRAKQDAQQKADEAAQRRQDEKDAQNSLGAKIGAYVMAKDFVSQHLKAPATAEFPVYDESFVQLVGDDTYRVSAYVDSQNGFGALLRANWTASVHKDGDTWNLQDIQIDEP